MEAPGLLKRLPPWARKIVVFTMIAAPISGAIGTGVTTYYEIKSAKDQAGAAVRDTDVNYKTLGPALAEAQEIIKDTLDWMDETDDELDFYKERVIYLEAYLETLSQRRGFPDFNPPHNHDHDYRIASFDYMPAASYMSTARPEPKAKPKRPERPIPQSLGDAKNYQEQRIIEDCSPSDPLCGALFD